MEKKEVLCITCPVGCLITALKVDGVWKMEGAACRKGSEYALTELTGPKRMVTSTVSVQDGAFKRLPVRTSAPVPIHSVGDVMAVIHAVEVSAPVKMGSVIVEGVAGTDVDLIATRDLT